VRRESGGRTGDEFGEDREGVERGGGEGVTVGRVGPVVRAPIST
jgi:hypothetical protein